MGWKLIPSTEEQIQSRELLTDLSQADVQFPVMDVAEMSAVEIAAHGMLENLVKNIGQYSEAGTQGLDFIKDFLATDIDPATSPLYKAMRDEASRLKSEGTSTIRRVGNIGMGGAQRSSPVTRQVGDYTAQVNTGLLQTLGQLQRENLAQKLGVAGGMTDLGVNVPQSILDQVATTGALPRSIQQMQNEALYGSATDTLTFPFTHQAPLAQSILNEPRYIYEQQKKKKSKSGIGTAIGAGAGFLFGGPVGAKIGATIGGGIGSTMY